MPTYLVPITLALLLSLPFFWRLEQDLQAHTATYLGLAFPGNSAWTESAN